MKLGAQLYTVRGYTRDLASFSETLKKIADIGYTAVQVSGTCAFDPDWLRNELDKNGLHCPLTHSNPIRIAEEPEAVAAEHAVFGCRYIGIGSAPGAFAGGWADYEEFRERYLPAAKRLRAAGCLFGYHNHAFEFETFGGPKTILQRLAEDFPADLMTFILDTYWIQFGGGDPADWITRLAGRVHCVHVKDMAFMSGTQRMAPIGEGNLNFNAILNACQQAGTEYLLVEQDDCGGEDPFDCLKRSFDYLKGHIDGGMELP